MSNFKFQMLNVDQVFETLISTDDCLKKWFDFYLKEEYKNDQNGRLNYVDMGEISGYLIEKLKIGQTENFGTFFDAVEGILNNCDAEVENLLVFGLFEDIQNLCGPELDYYNIFNKWLKPLSKSKWNELIDFWEGKD